MNMEQPITWYPGDPSGSPIGLIELARRGRNLALLENFADSHHNHVVIEFPLSEQIQRQTGYMRFVRLARPVSGVADGGKITFHECLYALIQNVPIAVARLSQNPAHINNREEARRQLVRRLAVRGEDRATLTVMEKMSNVFGSIREAA